MKRLLAWVALPGGIVLALSAPDLSGATGLGIAVAGAGGCWLIRHGEAVQR